jgi:hypothetical protein
MKYEIDDNKITMLGVVKDKLLLSSLGQIFVIKDFIVENGIETGLFGGKHNVKYITDIKIYAYNNEGKFLGVMRNNGCESMLSRYDFYVMRQQFVDFMEQLKSFGFEIVKIMPDVQNIKQ